MAILVLHQWFDCTVPPLIQFLTIFHSLFSHWLLSTKLECPYNLLNNYMHIVHVQFECMYIYSCRSFSFPSLTLFKQISKCSLQYNHK